MKYTLSKRKIKKIIKRHICLSLFLLYLFIRRCKLIIIETRLQHSTWWEGDELFNHSKHIIQVESSHRCSMKKAILNNFTIFTGKCLCWSLFLIKNFKATLSKRDAYTAVFCEYCGIFNTTCFEEHLRPATSIGCYFDTINLK